MVDFNWRSSVCNACQLWDPFSNKGMQSLEAVQKFPCKVCLKQWNLDYTSTLQMLGLPSLSVCRQYLKLTTMYSTVNDRMYCPPSILVTCLKISIALVHSTSSDLLHILIIIMYYSFVPSVISSWNYLPDSVNSNRSYIKQ